MLMSGVFSSKVRGGGGDGGSVSLGGRNPVSLAGIVYIVARGATPK